MSTKFSGTSYKPGIRATRNSQELWKICFNNEDLHGDLGDGDRASLRSSRAAGDSSGGEDEVRSSNGQQDRRSKYDETDEIELNNDMKNDRSRSKQKSNQEAYHMALRPRDTEIRAIPTDANGTGCTYSTMTVSNETTFSSNTKTDSSTPLRPGQTRFLIRRDSDLELLLPPQSDRVGALRKKAKECCSDCGRWPTWRKVLCVAILVIAAILLYVVIMIAIVKGVGG